jgi:DNA-binding response OmpR family regulator
MVGGPRSNNFQRVTPELGTPSLVAAVHVTTLARTLLDILARGTGPGSGPVDMAWSLDVARQLLEAGQLVDARTLVVHEDSWEITHAGRALALTVAQYRLLKELLQADQHTVRTHRLAAIMFGSGHREHDRVAAHVKRLRRRLQEEGITDCRIDAVRGVGYRLWWATEPAGAQ